MRNVHGQVAVVNVTYVKLFRIILIRSKRSERRHS